MTSETPNHDEAQADHGAVGGIAAVLPPLEWLRRYQAAWLGHDAVAGITLAAYAIPVSLAYASLAGLPPEYGIYCYLVGGIGYALFGSSRQLAVGPTSAIAMLVGATIADMAAGDVSRWAAIAALTAMVVGVLGALAWLARLSGLVNLCPRREPHPTAVYRTSGRYPPES